LIAKINIKFKDSKWGG